MINLSYNPFKKDIRDLAATDLSILKDTAEGWFVEYKSQVMSPKTIAKSLAAFANHYGGWVFYGVGGAKDGSNKADSFPGLGKAETTQLIEQLRNASKDCVNPAIYYEHVVLEGPCTEISLPDQKSVIVVAVPSGPDAPYIHIEGKVYRRVADASDPKPETDKFVLDNLWQRRREARERLAALLEQQYLPSHDGQEVSYLDLFFLTDPLGVAKPESKIKFDEFVAAMSDHTTLGITLIFDNFFTIAGGMIGRDVNINAPDGIVTTWRHIMNGSSIVSIPLSSGSVKAIRNERWLRGYLHEDALQKILDQGYTRGVVLDLNQLMQALLGCVRRQRQLMEIGDPSCPIFVKASLHNVKNRIPFLDTSEYIQFVTKHGLPIVQYNDAYAPPDTAFESLILMPDASSRATTISPDPLEQAKSAISWQAQDSAEIMFSILNALGLPYQFVLEYLSPDNDDSWWSAAERAPIVNRNRMTGS